jgi:NAD(P)-dependent dehydrogenase (short-subunit alcohol dehydrogenase family)
MKFLHADAELFAGLSHDRNPLHLDASYARRTPFGQRIVHGMLGVLAVLGETIRAPVELVRLEVRFLRPLAFDAPYAVSLEQLEGSRLVATLGTAESPCLRVEARFAAARPWPAARAVALTLRDEPADPGPPTGATIERSGVYAIDPAPLAELAARVGLDTSWIAPSQLAALAWSSWFVGMEVPGRQALFRSTSIDFAGAPDDALIRFDARVERYQPEASLFTVSSELATAAGPLARVALTAARRPPPVELEPREVEARLGRSTALRGKLALVTGSSRGLGAAIALGCALHGADVILHCREGLEDAGRVARAVRDLGRAAEVVAGDVAKRETWDALRSAADALGGPDLLVHSAAPVAWAVPFAESGERVVDLVAESTGAAVRCLRTFLPTLAERNGHVVTISSGATRKPHRDLAHEVAAKAAVEGLVAALAADHRSIRFVTVRPPRLHTDRTNDIFPALRGRPAADVAAAIVRSLLEPAGDANHVVLDRF